MYLQKSTYKIESRPFRYFHRQTYTKMVDVSYNQSFAGSILSYDPLDKYPGLSPYNYCANNSLIVTDPQGDTIKYLNPETKDYVEGFTSKTKLNGRGKTKTNRKYHEGFAKLIKRLDKDENVFLFSNEHEEENPNESGGVSYDGNQILVSFGDPDETYGGKSGLLFEEAFHAQQYLDNKYSFVKSPKSSTGWGISGASISLEYDAKKFAATAPGVTSWYTNSSGYRAETQLSLIKNMNILDGIDYLRNGISKSYYGYSLFYKPPYPK